MANTGRQILLDFLCCMTFWLFDIKRTWRRLWWRRVVCTKSDIYVVIARTCRTIWKYG